MRSRLSRLGALLSIRLREPSTYSGLGLGALILALFIDRALSVNPWSIGAAALAALSVILSVVLPEAPKS